MYMYTDQNEINKKHCSFGSQIGNSITLIETAEVEATIHKIIHDYNKNNNNITSKMNISTQYNDYTTDNFYKTKKTKKIM